MKTTFSAVLLGTALYLSAAAQEATFSTKSAALWLEPHLSGLALLREDGRAVYWGSETEVLASGLGGDSILSCGGQLYGTEADNDLLNISSGERGLKVALHSRPACLEDELVVLDEDASELLRLSADLQVQASVPVDALPDAELVTADLDSDGVSEIILLTGPTDRYAHAVLGDGLEAASVSVFSDDLDLIANYSLPEPFVIEQRRALPFAFDISGQVTTGMLLTRSSNQTGAGVVLLRLSEGGLELLAEAPPIGTGFRWLNAFASAGGSAYAVRTPHIGGPLERYRLQDGELRAEPFDLGVTNHVYGARNLDLGVLLTSDSKQDVLAVALQDLNGVRLISCAARCEVSATFETAAPLSSNLVRLERDGDIYVAFADTSGAVYVMEGE